MSKRLLILSIIVVAIIVAVVTAYKMYSPNAARMVSFRAWMNNPASNPSWKLTIGTQCGSAPFIFPTDGFVGFLWGEFDGTPPYTPRHRYFCWDRYRHHTCCLRVSGISARLPDWESTVIVRVPSDPLQPGRQIWLYYTHMADKSGNSFISEEFPRGTVEKLIEAGTFLGYQGNYSGDPNNPVGVHLHFSIVEDDGSGQFKNELEIKNTLDPSPYLGLPLNGYENRDQVPMCELDE